MGTYERRVDIWEKLRRRKQDTVSNLASEFGVSERTIRRDLECLVIEHPIITRSGRYGGVFVLDTAIPGYFSREQVAVLQKTLEALRQSMPGELTDTEVQELEQLLKYYTKPNGERT